MDPRIPAPIRPTLQAYFSALDAQLSGLISAFYLEGSIALGDFNPLFSDIDFLAILSREPTAREIDVLRATHRAIEAGHPRWVMSGSYIQAKDLDCWEEKAKPNPSYHDGTLRLDRWFELQSVEGWIVKNHGVSLRGPEPRDLPFSVNWDLLLEAMRDNLNSYWKGWTRRPDRLVSMLSDWGIQWAVLGVLRQYYSVQENTITSKSKAGEYGLSRLPSGWHRLINEALDIRAGRPGSAYRLRIMRAIEAVRFLKFTIQSCNADFG